MESEPSLTPISAVDHVRRESATPFSYRSALHALLGLSDIEERHVSYTRTVPPVEVRYSPQPLPDQPWHLPQAWQETDPSGFDEAAAHHPAPSAEPPAPDAAMPTGVTRLGARGERENLPQQVIEGEGVATEERETGDRGGIRETTGNRSRVSRPGASMPSILQQGDPDVTAAHGGVSGVATARVEQPDAGPQEATIAVPGISERRLYFPALAPAKQDNGSVGTTEEAEGAAREHEPSMSLDSNVYPPIPSFGGAGEGEGAAARREPHPSPWPEAGPLRTASEAETVGRLQDEVDAGANGDVAASIEQLRRTVRELAAKVGARQARPHEDLHPPQAAQASPQAAPRVVIIRPAAPQSGPPRAFWERRYLSRVSWRTLR
jgi:hypothetical protein